MGISFPTTHTNPAMFCLVLIVYVISLSTLYSIPRILLLGSEGASMQALNPQKMTAKSPLNHTLRL